MTLGTGARWLTITTALLMAGLIWRVAAWRPAVVVQVDLPDRFTRVTGVVHVHTTHSDGSGSPEEVEAAAASAELDFVIVTDHNSLAAKPREGYSNTGVLTIVGTEISNRQGHLLAVGLSQPLYRFSGQARDAIDDLVDLDSLAFAAHPESPRQDLRWNDWNLAGDWGLEILNGDSQWRAASFGELLWTLARYPLNRDYALLRLLQRPAAIERWDTILARRHATAIAGTDAHGTLRPGSSLPLALPTYEAVFRIAQNHVLLERPLTGNATEDIRALLLALSRGRSYIGLNALAPSDGFFFVAERDNQSWTMGDVVPTGGPLHMRAGGALPERALITLRHDGDVIASGEGTLDLPVVDPGVYRVEAELPGWEVPWIVSNPIYVLTAEERQRRAAEATLPPPLTVTALDHLDRFDSDSTFAPVADETTMLDPQIIASDTGPNGTSAARIAFRLGTPSPEHPSPYASLVSYEQRDLSAYEGIVVSVRSDATRRFWLQVRDENPSAPDGMESWFASVKATPEWRTVTVPFDQLYSVTQQSDGSLDPTQVQAIVFLVDTGAAPADAEGVIWIDELGVY